MTQKKRSGPHGRKKTPAPKKQVRSVKTASARKRATKSGTASLTMRGVDPNKVKSAVVRDIIKRMSGSSRQKSSNDLSLKSTRSRYRPSQGVMAHDRDARYQQSRGPALADFDKDPFDKDADNFDRDNFDRSYP